MCVQSQIDLRELLLPLGQCGFDKDVYVVLSGYIDESISGEHPPLSFGLSCIFAEGTEWGWASLAWRKVIEDKNRGLLAAGRRPIKRFHAADLNNFHQDFEDWNGAERTAFIEEIVKRVFSRHDLYSTGYTVSLKDVGMVFPVHAGKEISAGYYALTKMLMISLANIVEGLFGIDAKISLIYERCEYGGVMLEAFNSVKDDPRCEWRNKFTTLAPMGWEDCTPLQPADFLAYEIMKENHRTKPEVISKKARARRGSLNALLDSPNFKGDGANLTLENLQNLRAGMSKRAASTISSTEAV